MNNLTKAKNSDKKQKTSQRPKKPILSKIKQFKHNNKQPYEYLQHTADCKFKAYGKTIEEMFSNAALAMFNIIVDTTTVSPLVIKEINVCGDDEYQLLYNFLEQLLFLIDTESFLLHSIVELTIEGKVLHAKVYGDCKIEDYETHGDIKAVTYNEMEVTDKYVQVVVDL
ncbi:archease [Candidatus Woesearchaeota archaeon]|nr:archease [Candidatus Woesearchaeota archaeon]